jgi:hypothetical protein
MVFNKYHNVSISRNHNELDGLINRLSKSPVEKYIWVVNIKDEFDFGKELNYRIVRKSVGVLTGNMNKVDLCYHIETFMTGLSTVRNFNPPRNIFIPAQYFQQLPEKVQDFLLSTFLLIGKSSPLSVYAYTVDVRLMNERLERIKSETGE